MENDDRKSAVEGIIERINSATLASVKLMYDLECPYFLDYSEIGFGAYEEGATHGVILVVALVEVDKAKKLHAEMVPLLEKYLNKEQQSYSVHKMENFDPKIFFSRGDKDGKREHP